MTDKNHEQYLEQIETAVAETTKSLMDEVAAGKFAKLVAEKQVEINRLKEFQKDDRKTIREVRGHLKELAEEGVAEVTELNLLLLRCSEELEEWKAIHPEWSPSGDLTPNFISECLDDQYENIKELKKENEELENKVDELKSDLDGATEVNDELKRENEKLKEELEEWKAIHPEWSPSGDLTPNFISECLDDQYENIKELKKKVEELEEELEYEADTSFADLNEEIEKLKGERENASYQLAGELEDINTRWAEDKEADRIVIEKLKAEMNRVFQAVYSYDGDYDGKIDELEDKAKKDREITTQIAIKLEAAEAVLDGEGWGWDEEKQDYIED